jgi:addiction module RelE/StbE family toxin
VVNVRWAESAEGDRADILVYIGADNPAAAVRMDELFGAAAEKLADFPLMGQVGQIVGTREVFPHENYRMVYEIERETVYDQPPRICEISSTGQSLSKLKPSFQEYSEVHFIKAPFMP